MNATQQGMWEVPKGKFDSAMTRLAGKIGVEFGPVIDRLNSENQYLEDTAAYLVDPAQAFIQDLLYRSGLSTKLERLATVGSRFSKEDIATICNRAIERARKVFPRDYVSEPYDWGAGDHFDIARHISFLIDRHGAYGIFAACHLCTELSIALAVHNLHDLYQLDWQRLPWQLIDDTKGKEQREDAVHGFLGCYWVWLLNETGYDQRTNFVTLDELHESVWEHLKMLRPKSLN